MGIENELLKYGDIIDKLLDETLPKDNGFQGKVFESMRYSIFAGGKRLRPFLLLKTCEIISGDYNKSVPFALAVEMIHTYSLIHDDLPSMDNDDYRRGKLTNHKIYGDAIAILAGDGLLNFAYETITDSLLDDKENYLNKVMALKELSTAAGINGMIGGQVVDILSEDKNIDKNTLDYIHNNKTSALIEASIIAGAYIGGANSIEINALREYGKAIGLGFQIRDDILDKVGNSEKLGKNIGSDEENNKATYISLYGLENSIKKTEELCNIAINSLDKLENKDVSTLKELAKFLVYREN